MEISDEEEKSEKEEERRRLFSFIMLAPGQGEILYYPPGIGNGSRAPITFGRRHTTSCELHLSMRESFSREKSSRQEQEIVRNSRTVSNQQCS